MIRYERSCIDSLLIYTHFGKIFVTKKAGPVEPYLSKLCSKEYFSDDTYFFQWLGSFCGQTWLFLSQCTKTAAASFNQSKLNLKVPSSRGTSAPVCTTILLLTRQTCYHYKSKQQQVMAKYWWGFWGLAQFLICRSLILC